jgi:hypothetical protein
LGYIAGKISLSWYFFESVFFFLVPIAAILAKSVSDGKWKLQASIIAALAALFLGDAVIRQNWLSRAKPNDYQFLPLRTLHGIYMLGKWGVVGFQRTQNYPPLLADIQSKKQVPIAAQNSRF